MVASEPTNISAAFEMLLEEIEIEIDNFGQIAARASGKREFEKAKEAIETAEKITTFRDKVAMLQEEWDKLEKQSISNSDDINIYSKRRNPRYKRRQTSKLRIRSSGLVKGSSGLLIRSSKREKASFELLKASSELLKSSSLSMPSPV